MDRWTQDLRFAARSLQGRPAFTALAVLTLAVGLGTSIAMFGVVRGVLLRPLPHPESERIVSFHRSFTDAPGVEARSMSLPDLRDVQAELSSFEAVAGCNEDQLSSSASGRPELLQAGLVTDGVLAVFGLDPFLGRDLTAKDAEPGTAPVAVLAHHYWRSHLGERPDVLGQALEIGGRAHTVVGVAPPGFSFPNQAQVWVPRQINPEGCGRGCHLIHTVGRLAPGVSLESAEQELAVLGSQLEKTYPRSNTHKRFGVRGLQDQMVGNVKPALWMLLAAVQLVVLIAAANVTHLVMARGTGRARELAVRSALGASRGRLFGQLLMENGLLVAAGLGAALVLARGLLGLLPMVAPGNLPRLGEVEIDGTVVGFSVVLALGSVLLSGMAPAWRLSMPDLRSRGQAGTHSGRRWRSGLLAGEVALSLMLLLGAGLLMRSFAQQVSHDLGFEKEGVLRFSLDLPSSEYDSEGAARFFARLEAQLATLPGVESVGTMFAAPFGKNRIGSAFMPLDRPAPGPGAELTADFHVVSPGTFETLGIPVLAGRSVDASDRLGGQWVAVVSESLAERHYPGKTPIGEQMNVGLSFGLGEDGDVYTIVGVVGDTQSRTVSDRPRPAIYLAQAQTGVDHQSVLIRTSAGRSSDDSALVDAVRRGVHALDPNLPLRSVETLEQAVGRALGPARFYFLLLGCFAAIAVGLSAVGLYGVVSFLVGLRTRELAVRSALGATAGDQLRLVLGDALRPALAGIVVGLAGALASSRLLGSLLFGVSAHDGLTFALAPILLLSVAGTAALIPALRTLRVDPRSALGSD